MKKFWIILMAILSLIFGSGCAAIPKKQRLAIAAECGDNIVCIAEKETEVLEQIEYEREARREEDRDKLRTLVLGCYYSENVLVFDGFHTVGGIAERKRDGTVYIPRNARSYDYYCTTRADLREALRRAGLSN